MNSRIVWWSGAGLGVLLLFGLWQMTNRPTPEPLADNPVAISTRKSSTKATLPVFPIEPDPTPREPLYPEDNAAVTYREAFALWDTFTDAEKDILSNWQTNVDTAVTAELCAKLEPLLDLMHEAGAQTHCDWGLGEITVTTTFPHLSRARAIGRAAIWRATNCGAPATTADDLISVLQLGQHISADGPLIALLVDWALEGLASAALATNLAILNPSDVGRVMEVLAGDDVAVALGRAIERESRYVESMGREIEKLPPEEFRERWGEAATMFLDQAAAKLEQGHIAQAVAAIAARQHQLARVVADGAWQELAIWEDEVRQLGVTNPLAAMWLSAYETVVCKMQRVAVNRALLQAAAAIVRNGPAALANHRDPASGEPFAFRETENGFALQSKMHHNDEPISLLVPVPK